MLKIEDGGTSVRTRPSASIVIPAYNAARRIGFPLEALATQEIEDGSFEVIVVDNASTDTTAARQHGLKMTQHRRDWPGVEWTCG